MSERDASVAGGEDPISILLDAADNIADYHDGGWGLSRGVVDAAKAKIATHAGEVERLREALDRQCDNMAFVLNKATLPDQWYCKFSNELKEARQGGRAMNMNERIARALARHSYAGASDADIDEMWEGWADDATAAIQAMREPTPGMVEAGKRMAGEDAIIVGAWQAMIDAAAIDTGAGEG